jgi:hypothetical protein
MREAAVVGSPPLHLVVPAPSASPPELLFYGFTTITGNCAMAAGPPARTRRACRAQRQDLRRLTARSDNNASSTPAETTNSSSTGENRDRGLPIEPSADRAPTPLPLVADPDLHSEDEVPDAEFPKRDIDDRA